ncbi:lysozyme-like domain-containing protein [Chytridium lagenaria]|nr:lysozyme-like domain-containing protein [Chytridium lagenaria]
MRQTPPLYKFLTTKHRTRLTAPPPSLIGCRSFRAANPHHDRPTHKTRLPPRQYMNRWLLRDSDEQSVAAFEKVMVVEGPTLNTTCIDSLYTCGPPTPSGHGTIHQCISNAYILTTICNAATYTSCAFISGQPYCVNAGTLEKRQLVLPPSHVGRVTPSAPRRVTSRARPAPTGRPDLRNVVDPETITSVFETSNQNLGFNLCGNWNDGQGISAGFIQFTTSSGSALRVVQTYLQLTRRPNPPIASFLPALQRAAQVGNQGAVWGQGFMTGLWGFCESWQEANTNDAPAFQNAQLAIQSAGYLEPNRGIIQRLGLRTALGVGQVMDTGIQLGYGAVEEIARNAGWTPGQGAEEVDFLRRWLDARVAHMLQRGNLNFVGGTVEMFGEWGESDADFLLGLLDGMRKERWIFGEWGESDADFLLGGSMCGI